MIRVSSTFPKLVNTYPKELPIKPIRHSRKGLFISEWMIGAGPSTEHLQTLKTTPNQWPGGPVLRI